MVSIEEDGREVNVVFRLLLFGFVATKLPYKSSTESSVNALSKYAALPRDILDDRGLADLRLPSPIMGGNVPRVDVNGNAFYDPGNAFLQPHARFH